ncbi:MAG: diguanylate cyclase [Promethearchaeota archaeon]
MKWIKELNYAITVADKDGIILEMNDKSVATVAKYGGADLIGKSVFDCHHPVARKKLENLYETHEINAYTIQKKGIKKLVYQAPWFENGEFRGYVELSLPIPQDMPHYFREC